MIAKRNRILIASQILAIVIGVGAAAASIGHGASAEPVLAANHCTRYAPNTSPDVTCWTSSTIDGAYRTNYVGWRTGNTIHAITGIWWELWYQLYDGSLIDYTSAFGQDGYIGSPSYPAQAYAGCNDVYSPVGGYCTTTWHD